MIKRLSAILGLICVIVFCIAAIMMYRTEQDIYRVTMIAMVVFGATIYILSNQIDWWFFKKIPPKIDDLFKSKWLFMDPFYQSLNKEESALFEHRMALYIEAKEWIPKQFEIVPSEIQHIIAYYAVITSWESGKYLYEPYDRIVVYAHAFVTPEIPNTFHHVEKYQEDGVLLFTADSLQPVLQKIKPFFNPALYIFLTIDAPKESNAFNWDTFLQKTGISKNNVEEIIGKEVTIDYNALENFMYFYK